MPGADRSRAWSRSPSRRWRRRCEAGLNFAKLGVNLRLAVNIPVNALVKIAVADIVQNYRPQYRQMAGPDHRRDRGADRHRSQARQRYHQEARSTSTSSSRSTISAAAIPRWCGSRSCRSPSSSSTAPLSPIAAPTRSMRRCARPSSTSRTISAASPWRSASRRPPTRWRWSAWAATTARASCSASRCRRSASSRCLRQRAAAQKQPSAGCERADRQHDERGLSPQSPRQCVQAPRRA